jgi:hypothetical protein
MVSECVEENNRLRQTLSAFSDLENTGSSPYLLEQFEEDVRRLSHRIDERPGVLSDLHKQLASTKEERILPVDNRAEKKQLLKENKQLVNRALYLEKQMISSKLRLRLSHDFCRLRRQLGRLASPGTPETAEDLEIQKNRERIKNLKRGIEHETKRLIRLAVPVTAEVEAAELIQRFWRGCLARQKLNDQASMRPIADLMVEEFQELAKSDDERQTVTLDIRDGEMFA